MNFKPYPMLRYLFLLIAGMLLSECYSPGAMILPAGLLTAVFIFIPALLLKNQTGLKASLFVWVLLLGWWMADRSDQRKDQRHFLNRDPFSDYLVHISSLSERKPASYKCLAEVKAVRNEGHWRPATGKTILYFAGNTRTRPSFGDIFLIRGMPDPIDAPRNQYDFDYKAYQQRRNVFTQQFLKEGDFLLLGSKQFRPLFEFAGYLSTYSDTIFRKYLGSAREVGVAEALVAGMRTDLDQEIITAYSVSGAIHVLSVSGMHVGILFLVINWLIRMVAPEKEKKPATVAIVILLLWIYALYTGLSPSACRATLMFSLIQFGYAIKREGNSYNIIAFSAFVLLLVNPSWLFDVGFQLSYLAVLGIIMLYGPISRLLEIKNKGLRWIWEISVVSFSAQLFTFPLALYYFHQFPTYFLLANPVVAILATPLLPLGLLLILLSPIPSIALILGKALGFLTALLNEFLIWTKGLPMASYGGINISIPELGLLYLFIAALISFFRGQGIIALKVSAGAVVLLTILMVLDLRQQLGRREITIHYIPGSSAISLIHGRAAFCLAPDSLLKDQNFYPFRLKGYYDHNGIMIRKERPVGRDGGEFTDPGSGKTIVWIMNSLPEVNPEAEIYLISGDAVRSLDMFQHYKGRIVLDGSNRKRTINRFKQQAEQLGLDLISLRENGSVTISLNAED